MAVRDENCNLGPEPVQDRGLALGHLGQELVVGAEGAQSVNEHFKPRTSTSTLGQAREDSAKLVHLLELLGVIQQLFVAGRGSVDIDGWVQATLGETTVEAMIESLLSRPLKAERH